MIAHISYREALRIMASNGGLLPCMFREADVYHRVHGRIKMGYNLGTRKWNLLYFSQDARTVMGMLKINHTELVAREDRALGISH